MRKLFYIKPHEREYTIRAAMSWDEYGNVMFDYSDSLKGYYDIREASMILLFRLEKISFLDPIDYDITEK